MQGAPRFEDPGEGSYPMGTGDVDPKFKRQAANLTLEGGSVFITNGVPYIRKLEYTGKQHFMRWTTQQEVRKLGRITAKKVRVKRFNPKRRTRRQRIRNTGACGMGGGTNPWR